MAGAVQDKELLIVNNFVMYATIMLQSLPLSTRHSIDARSDVKKTFFAEYFFFSSLFSFFFPRFGFCPDPDVLLYLARLNLHNR